MSTLIHRHGLVACAAVLACLSPVRPAAAHETPSTSSAQATWGLGYSYYSFQRSYAGDANATGPFPLINFENAYLRVAGAAVDLKLGSAGPLRFLLRAKYALSDGYKSGDAPMLEGMQSRHASLWLGPVAQWDTGLARFSFEVLDDVIGKTKGVQGKLGVDRDFHLGSFMLTPRLAAEFVDRKYVAYYYGVTAAEATPARPAYGGKSTVNVEAGLRTTYAIDHSNVIFADFSAKAYGKGITDSPLVGRRVTPGIVLGYSYRF